MKTMFISLLVTMFLSSACNSSKQAAAPETKPVVAEASATAQPQKTEDMYRLIVSFISIGEGTDPKVRATMDEVLKNWQDRFKITFKIDEVPWGREGEIDFCFKLSELKAEEQANFVDEMKTVFEGNGLVQISENQPSRFKK